MPWSGLHSNHLEGQITNFLVQIHVHNSLGSAVNQSLEVEPTDRQKKHDAQFVHGQVLCDARTGSTLERSPGKAMHVLCVFAEETVWVETLGVLAPHLGVHVSRVCAGDDHEVLDGPAAAVPVEVGDALGCLANSETDGEETEGFLDDSVGEVHIVGLGRVGDEHLDGLVQIGIEVLVVLIAKALDDVRVDGEEHGNPGESVGCGAVTAEEEGLEAAWR